MDPVASIALPPHRVPPSMRDFIQEDANDNLQGNRVIDNVPVKAEMWPMATPTPIGAEFFKDDSPLLQDNTEEVLSDDNSECANGYQFEVAPFSSNVGYAVNASTCYEVQDVLRFW